MNTLTTFIRQRRDAIVDEWASRAAHLPSGHHLAALALRDHVPAILDQLADAIDRRDETSRPLQSLPERHAAVRFREGYDLRQVVAEYRLLRQVVVEMYQEQGGLSPDARVKLGPLVVMHEAMDRAMSEAVDQYAVERDRVRDIFIAMLGHDLRDPLSAMVFGANALRDRSDQFDGPTAKTIARMATSAERMERLIRDLLDFARGRLGGGFVVVPAPCDARVLIGRTVQEIAHAHPDRMVRSVDDTANGDFHVEWDSDRIEQVITNLVGNALTHGKDPIVVVARDEGDEVSIHVSNSGEIAPETLPRLFDPFTPDAPHKRRAGLGLGLYIVQQIAQAHGGVVRATSVDGQTTISVTLPRHARHAAP